MAFSRVWGAIGGVVELILFGTATLPILQRTWRVVAAFAALFHVGGLVACDLLGWP